jgi:hypothetical protein
MKLRLLLAAWNPLPDEINDHGLVSTANQPSSEIRRGLKGLDLGPEFTGRLPQSVVPLIQRSRSGEEIQVLRGAVSEVVLGQRRTTRQIEGFLLPEEPLQDLPLKFTESRFHEATRLHAIGSIDTPRTHVFAPGGVTSHPTGPALPVVW